MPGIPQPSWVREKQKYDLTAVNNNFCKTLKSCLRTVKSASPYEVITFIGKN